MSSEPAADPISPDPLPDAVADRPSDPSSDPQPDPQPVATERAAAADDWPQRENEIEFAAAERMTFFSDAVVAIALTLLALDLPVPEGDSVSSVLHGLDSGLGEYLAFAISFAVISTHWRTHHRIFRYVNRVDRRLIALNMGWLFLVVITPWSTRLLSAGEINFLKFAQYAALQTVQYLVLSAMIFELIRGDLLHSGTDRGRLRASLARITPVGIGFGLSIPGYLLLRLTGISPYWSYALWGVLPTVFGFAGRRLRVGQTAEYPQGPTRPPKSARWPE